MIDVLLVLALAAAMVAAVLSARKRRRRGSTCCGEREEAVVRLRVADRDRSRYPYRTMLAVGGMTCENCAIRVENALNALPGTWARVSIGSGQAEVLTKKPPEADALRAAVREAGYVVTGLEAG